MLGSSAMWSGMLTRHNADDVACMLYALLDGKRFTFVEANEFFDFEPDVRTGQRLANNDSPIMVSRHASGLVGVSVHDSYGFWDMLTNLEENVYDSKFRNPHISFARDRVLIRQRVPAGHLIWLLAVVEQEEEWLGV